MKGTNMTNKNEVNNKKNNKIEIETLVKSIVKIQSDKEHEMEKELLTKKMMRQLYKELGDPNPADYKGVGEFLYSVDKMRGYTVWVETQTKSELKRLERGGDVRFRIKRPSETKMNIVERYTKAGWNCDVQAYNVSCDKYMPHKDYDNIWVRFISTRDCSKYEYVLVKED